MSDRHLLDASALLALIFREPGHQLVAAACPAAISAANLSEVVAKLVERGVPPAEAATPHREAGLEVLPVTEEIALRAGLLRDVTRSAGLSLGDRLCLATAQSEGLDILTADSAWPALADRLGLAITNIRSSD